MNTSGLQGRSVEVLLAIRKLSDVSVQYLNSLRQYLAYSKQSPDSLGRSARRRPRAFENRFLAFLGEKERDTSPATIWLVRNSVKKFLDVNGVAGIDWTSINDRKTEFKREILLKVGGYSKDEVDRLDLAGMGDADIQKMVRERLLGAMENNGNHQRFIPLRDVEDYITKGWEYVGILPKERAILRLPG